MFARKVRRPDGQVSVKVAAPAASSPAQSAGTPAADIETAAPSAALSPAPEMLTQIVAGIRAFSGRDADIDKAIAEAEAEREATRWNNLLVELDNQYGIPAEVVERSGTKSEWCLGGVYEGGVSVCGIDLVVSTDILPTKVADQFGFACGSRVRLSRPGRNSQPLTVEELADMFEAIAG